MTNKTGGSAFPCDLTAYDKEVQIEMGGMTLRDYFAAKALQGMCANTNDDHNPYEMSYAEYVEEIAGSAYLLADAMLKARKL